MSLHVNGVTLQCVDSVLYLWHTVSSNDKDSMVTADKAHFWHVVNLFMSDFGHIYSFLNDQLFSQHCCSFYWAPLWYLKSDGIDDICVAWWKALWTIYDIIVKAAATPALVNPMSCAGRNLEKYWMHTMTKRLYIMNGIRNVMKWKIV